MHVVCVAADGPRSVDARDRIDTNLGAIEEQVVGNDHVIRVPDQDPAGEVIEDVVVDLIELVAAFDMDSVRIYVARNIGEDVACDAVVAVADIEPDAVGMANVANDIVTKQQIVGAVHLGAAGLGHPRRVLPADPLEKILLHQYILGTAGSSEAFNPAVAEHIVAHDVEAHGLWRFAQPPSRRRQCRARRCWPTRRCRLQK